MRTQLTEEQKMLLVSIYEQTELLKSRKGNPYDTVMVSILTDGALEIYVSPLTTDVSKKIRVERFIDNPGEVYEAFVAATEFMSNPLEERRQYLASEIAKLQDKLNRLNA